MLVLLLMTRLLGGLDQCGVVICLLKRSKRRTVANAAKKAKNDWFQQKAKEVEDKVM